jgi:glutathione S-transferase
VFGWASVLALLQAGTVRIPVFMRKGQRLAGSRSLVDHLDKTCRPGRALLPTDATLRAEVDLDCKTFQRLGYSSAVIAYYHLLPHREIMLEPVTRGVPRLEALAVQKAYPLFASQFRLLLRLTKAHAEKALTQARAILNEVEARLGNGQRFLVGSQLTLSDVVLAVTAGPLILPEGSASAIPPFEVMPPAYQNIVTEMRGREIARFVERIYRDYRKT